MKILLLTFSMAFSSSIFAQSMSNTDFAKSLSGRSFQIVYKSKLSSKSVDMKVEKDNLIVSSKEWGTCTGKLNVMDGDSSKIKIVADNGGLFCTKLENPKYIQFQLDLPTSSIYESSSNGIIHVLYNGNRIIDLKKATIHSK